MLELQSGTRQAPRPHASSALANLGGRHVWQPLQRNNRIKAPLTANFGPPPLIQFAHPTHHSPAEPATGAILPTKIAMIYSPDLPPSRQVSHDAVDVRTTLLIRIAEEARGIPRCSRCRGPLPLHCAGTTGVSFSLGEDASNFSAGGGVAYRNKDGKEIADRGTQTLAQRCILLLIGSERCRRNAGRRRATPFVLTCESSDVQKRLFPAG